MVPQTNLSRRPIMFFSSWLRNLKSSSGPARPINRLRPRLEALEDRALPSGVSFSAPVSYYTVDSVALDTVADFNGDGKLDIAAMGFGDASVLLGKGDGTFHSPLFVPVSSSSYFGTNLAVGDFNGDGKPDLVAGAPGAFFGHDNVSVLLGNGDGTFQTARLFSVGYGPIHVAVGDFNRDGKPDIVAANRYDNTVSVLLGNGDGTFQAARNVAVGSPFDVAVGDFNGDGKPDLAVRSGPNGNVSVLLGNGDGTFQPLQQPAISLTTSSFAVGDFNGDGKQDLAATTGRDVYVALGNGDGTFQTAQLVSTGEGPIVVADFNGDGKPDLVIGNETGGANLNVLLGNGDGTFQAYQFRDGGSSIGLAAGDLNNDGRPDLVVGHDYTSYVDVLLNAFPTTTAVSGPASSSYGQPLTYTATVTSDGAPVTAGTVTFVDNGTPLTGALPVNANGQVSFRFVPVWVGSHTIIATYSGTPGGAGSTGFGPSTRTVSLTVNPTVLSASAVNFSATAGAPFTGAVATLTTANPFASGAALTVTITWGDGSTSTGSITGTGPLTVSGGHTYADPRSYAVTVQISHPLGYTNTVTVYPTATVTTLGQGVKHGLTGDIGFWHNTSGQALINSFNGGPDATALGTWLATSFPNLYGGIYGWSNQSVAGYYQNLFDQSGSNAQANVLATALNVYATTQSLGGTAGQAYGFIVTATGLGADSFNIGADGAAFGVPNKTTLNVYELLQAVNRLSSSYTTILWNEVADLLSALNQAGAIS
jgi:hypothetical protein